VGGEAPALTVAASSLGRIATGDPAESNVGLVVEWRGGQPGHTARARASGAPSAVTFVAKVILAAIAVVMAGALVATAPATVTVPIAVVFSAGLVASTLVGRRGRHWVARRTSQDTNGHTAAPDRTGERPGLAPSEGREPAASRDLASASLGATDALGAAEVLGAWGALGAVSVSLLVLALAVGEPLGAVLVTLGLAGVAVLRIAATYTSWGRRGSHFR
jgi:small-conductance mechanosensitive channel